MKLAYQRAFEGLRSKNFNYFQYGQILSFLVGIAISLFMVIYFSNELVPKSSNLNEFVLLEEFITSYLTSLDILLIQHLESISFLEDGILEQIKDRQGFNVRNKNNYSNDFTIEPDQWILAAI
jgi:hypothetical protein